MPIARIDPATQLGINEKQPWEERLYNLDFVNNLDGRIISTITSVTSEIRGNVSGSSNVVLGVSTGTGGTAVQLKISGGVDLEDYKITARVVDSGGNKLEGEGMLYVRDL